MITSAYLIVYQTDGPAYYLTERSTFVGWARGDEAQRFKSRSAARERALRLPHGVQKYVKIWPTP